MLAYSFLNLGPRQNAPRNGLTMVLDKGLGLNETDDLIATAAGSIDFVKFGWGTSATMDRKFIMTKVQKYIAAGITPYPGGTLLEVALLKNQLDAFFAESKALGFTALEVSDGSTKISAQTRAEIISKAKENDFFVISEVGKKNPDLDHQLSIQMRLEEIRADLAAKADLVIIEAREAGKNIGIYDAQGNIIEEELDQIATIGTEKLIFEAPLKKQQVDLILKFGSQVNLGNIAATDAVSLETLRTGLRGDTVNKIKF
ncbi:phosphosulfolactate synthase [Oenococcus kitaharae]|uniref:Phosphosulfolactate synthase n=1 Tax=Oenococcus kitaharae DSM 17330 TaxID=1045004 RepID=G9WH39_9LACO|nr:phosphosulfolactate synthase [Oenococcus kitaharae]EHN59528.1 Phosphosulfolactate synthase [Oenococcus kitaharae DSM 17330]OEY83383.1 phosphosulfolactate synthase [Oenococcus kitaharae]OEY85182.1 phosphosulfolactate synthase [Oenococcus kitaharae]OEY86036.1 phosphosulfolactate synthase [Oenococcus kitaharae]